MLVRLITLVALLGTCVAGPLPSESIPWECNSPSPLIADQTFVYTYEGQNKIDNKDIHHNILIKATVEVSTLSPCLLSMNLRDVTLQEVNVANRRAFKEALERFPIVFRVEEGIVGEIRHAPQERPWATNVKRAIISMLQIPRTAVDANSIITETDVLGSCETRYSPVSVTHGETTIIKTKDLATCFGRFGSSLPIIYTPYEARSSAFQTLPVTNGTYKCEQTVNEKRWVTRALCMEKEFLHLAAKALTEQTTLMSTARLMLRDTIPGARSIPPTINVATTLKFDHSVMTPQQSTVEEALRVLRDLCSTIAADVRPNTGYMFSHLVSSLRGLTYQNLKTIYTKINSGELCFDKNRMSQQYLDALPLIGSEGSVKQMAELIVRPEHGSRVSKWISSLYTIQVPSLGMVASFNQLIRKPNPSTDLILALTSLAHTSCRGRVQECEQTKPIRDLQAALNKLFGYKCRVQNTQQRQKAITALKGFGNMGMHGEAINSILECAQSANNALPVRLAAIEAFRKTCIPHAQSKLREMMKNPTENIEVRIAAYLAVIRCPSEEIISDIVKMLEIEPVNQVGSFIYSHLKNHQQTECPIKQHLRDMLSGIRLENKFSNDIRKSSQNIEWSKYADQLNMGGVVDINAVYSPDSFIPRSAMLNLTVDLFSHSINLFEIGARAEGYEHLLEHVFATKEDEGIQGNKANFWTRLSQGLSRRKRAAVKDVSVDIFDDRINLAKPSHPQGSIYFRMFGNEFSWYEIPSFAEISMFGDRIGNTNWIGKMFNKNRDIVHSAMLVDLTVTAPTITGFPFMLDLNATMSAALKTDGRVNLNGAPQDFIIEGSIQPSAVVYASGLMAIDMGVAKRGVRIASTVHTSTMLDGKVEVIPSGDINIVYNMPRNKQEILNLKTDIYSVDAEVERPLPQHERKIFNGCTRTLSKALGVSLCMKGNVPKPFIGYGGITMPFDLEISLQKNEISMTGYELNLKYRADENDQRKQYQLLFDTPGSSVQRKHIIELQTANIGDDGKILHFLYSCPLMKIDASTQYIVSSSLMKFEADMKLHETKHYYMKANADIERGSDSIRIIPRFEMSYPGMADPLIMTGIIDDMKGQSRLSIEFNKPANKPAYLRAALRNQDEKMLFNLTADMPYLEVAYGGSLILHENSLATSMLLEYQWASMKKHSVRLSSKLRNLGTRHLQKSVSDMDVQLSQYPEYNWKIQTDVQKKGNEHREYDIKFWWGENLPDDVHFIHFLGIGKQTGDVYNQKAGSTDIQMKLTAPFWDVDVDSTLSTKLEDIESAGTKADTRFEISSRGSRIMLIGYTYGLHSRSPLHITASAEFDGFNRRLVYRDQVQERAPGQFEGNTVIEWGREGKNVAVDYVVTLKTDEKQYFQNMDIKISYPNMRAPIRHRSLIRIARNAVEATTETAFDGKGYFSVEAKHTKRSSSLLLDIPYLQFKALRTSKDGSWYGKVELRPRAFTPDEAFIASVELKKKPEMMWDLDSQFLWDADRNPERRFRFVITSDKADVEGKVIYKFGTVIELTPSNRFTMNVDIARRQMEGPHALEIKLEQEGLPRRLMTSSYSNGPKGSNFLIRYFKDDAERFRLDYVRIESNSGREIDARITSAYSLVDGKRLNVKHSYDGRSFTGELKYIHDATHSYSLAIRDTSGNNRVNNVIKYSSPYMHAEFQTTGEYTPTEADLKTVLTQNGKEYRFGIGWQIKGRGSALVSVQMFTPHQSAKDGSFLFKYDLNPGMYEGETRVTFNEEVKLEMNGLVKHDLDNDNVDARFKFYTPCTQHVELRAYAENTARTNTYGVGATMQGEDVFKGFVRISSTMTELVARIQVEGKHIPLHFLEYKRIAQVVEDRIVSYHYTLEHGLKPGFTIVIVPETQGDDIKLSIRLKPKEQPENEASLTIEYNKEQTDDNKKLIVIFEPKRNAKTSLVYLFQRAEGKTAKKVFWSLDDTKLGYEYELQKREASGIHWLKVFYLQREMHFHCQHTRTPDSYEGHWKILLNAIEMPERMLHMSYRRDRIEGGWTSEARISHPVVKDLVFKSRFQEKPEQPIVFSAEFQPGDETNKIFFDLIQTLNDGIATNQSTRMRLHHQDPDVFDASLTFYHTTTMESPLFAGYFWDFRTRKQSLKRGHATAFLGRNNRAIVDYDSFFGRFQGEGSRQIAPNGDDITDLTFTTDGKEFKGRIILKPEDHHVEALMFDSHGKPTRSLVIAAGPASSKKRTLSLELSKYVDGDKRTDFSYSIEKRSHGRFRNRLFFPPRNYETVKRIFLQGQESLSTINFAAVMDEIAHFAEKSWNLFVEQFFDPIATLLAEEMGEMIGEALNGFNDVYYEGSFSEMLQKLSAEIEKLFTFIQSTIMDIIDSLPAAGPSREHGRRRRDVSSSIDELRSYISDFIDSVYNSRAAKIMFSLIEDIVDTINYNIGELWYKVKTKGEQMWDNFMENPDVKAITSTFAEIYQPGTYEANYNFWEKLEKRLTSGWSAGDTIVEADTQRGKYIWDVRIPLDSESISQGVSIWTAGETGDDLVRSPSTGRIIASVLSSKLMPPFDGQALIVGDQHIITFDGTTYSFAGECMYMLARDFVDGNFTVLIRYDTDTPTEDGTPTKSFIIKLKENLIELFPGKGAVYMNGQPVELPLFGERGDLILTRSHDVITVEQRHHVKVSCYLYHDVCVVTVSGWYFGKTAGLLGTFNNEPSDDLMRPRGGVINNIGQFVKKWEVERGCKGPVKVIRDQAAEGSEGYELCRRYFKQRDSPLAPGFWKESTELYLDMCLRETAARPENIAPGACKIALAYLKRVEKYGIKTTLPSECYICKVVGNKDLGFGQKHSVYGNPRSMDVVFVVEEDSCHGNLVRDIDTTVRLVDKELLNAGYVNNRFGLIGFGHKSGKNSEPHIRTARDNIFFASQDMILAAEKMRLEPVINRDSSKADIFAAIAYAVNMPFRAGEASRSIVLMACSDCSEDNSHLSYSDIQRTLLERGITLHLVADKPIKVRKSAIKGKGIYGIDADTVYGNKDISQAQLIGQPDLRPQIATAKDICIALAQEAHGSFFSSKALRGDGKNWKSIFSRRIAKPIQAQPQPCEQCECIHDDGISPRTVCRPCQPLAPKVPLAVYTSDDLEY
ncbi:apolipophorins-like [Ornithodoros turicata]|uniref:apolipophorins-like n=1 Tax=Ornithodoros turicata TaxID=34597 RepID=UPI003138E679